VTKAYENKVAVRNLSLSIDAGQMFGLLGPNGAGKTSSIRMMMGITIPDSGRINLFGKPFERKSLERVGYLPEERGLYKKMKVLEQLVFFGQLHGLTAERGAQAGHELGRAHGDRRRAQQEDRRAFQGHAAEDSVHCVAAARSGLIVMDEPFSGLDPVNAVLVERDAARAERPGQGDSVFDSSHGPGGEAVRFHLPRQQRRGGAGRQGARDQGRYERNHVVVEFEGSAEFLNSEEIAEAKNFSGHAEIRLKPHGDAQKAACTRHRPEPRSTDSNWSSHRSKRSSSRPWEARPMRNILLIARREYLEQMRGRAFRLTTIGLARGVRADHWRRLLLKSRLGCQQAHGLVIAPDAMLANAIRTQLVER
jgi:ABC-2 type transport system ATP-binding protein